MPYKYTPVVLTIFDGWGVAPDSEGNAVTRAKTPNFSNYLKNYPAMTLFASGVEVGLMFGEIGNSEVGHLNIGAGRVYYQSCPRLNAEIANGNFFKNKAFLDAINQAKKNNGVLHLIGLIGNGRVHASSEHLYALLELCRREKFKEVFIHVILDGRDSLYNAGEQFLKELMDKIKELKTGKIASLTGRWWAMDRDNQWDRIEKAYEAMALGRGMRTNESAPDAVKESYAEKNYDEEFKPTVIVDKKGEPLANINDGDAVIFFNFRPDRARELTKAFVLPGFDKFKRRKIKDLFFVTMMEFEKDLPAVVAYAPSVVRNSLAEVVSRAGLKQFHVAETQKYAHVTLFLNGTVEEPFSGEDRVLVPSQRIDSYAKAPEMSAAGVAKEAVKAIDSGKYDLVVLNFANPDMVAHTGDIKAAIKACEVVDDCLKQVVEHTLAAGGVAVVTADHGNAEEVINLQTGEIDKEHSTNPVPFIVIGKDFMGTAGPGGDAPEGDLSLMPPVGVLEDVAPTVLALMGLPQPSEMTGKALI